MKAVAAAVAQGQTNLLALDDDGFPRDGMNLPRRCHTVQPPGGTSASVNMAVLAAGVTASPVDC